MADSTQYAKYTGISSAAGGVTSLNGLTGALTLVGTGGITITPSGSTITIDGSADQLVMGPFGSTPNANGGTIAAGVLTLQPADGTHPGGVSILAQTLAGVKTFSSQTLFSSGTAGAPGIAFSSDLTSGLYLVTNDELALTVSGAQVLDMRKSTGGFGNLGMGGVASLSDSFPLLIQRDVASAGVTIQIDNIDTAANSFANLKVVSDSVSGLVAAYNAASTVPPYINALVIRSADSGHHVSIMGGENAGDDVGIWTNGDFTSAGQLMNFNADKSVSFMQQISTPTTPASGTAKLYQKSDGRLYQKSAAGTERILGSSDTAGTVTSVAMTVPTFLSIGGSPITTSGTLALTLSGTALPVLNGGTGVTSLGNFTDAGTDGITVTGGTGAVITSMSIAQHVADTTHNGYLSSTDWNTFNGKGSGSVTSVAMTVPSFLSIGGSPITTSGTLALTLSGTALPVANGGTGLTAGTSGGVLGYTATGTLASSALLTANGLVLGGGAGATPTSTAAGTTDQILKGVTSSAPVWASTLPIAALGGQGAIHTATFTTPSTSSSSTVYYFVCVGGGGGGGGSNGASSAAGGGGAGGVSFGTFSGIAASTSVTIATGAAGSAGANTGANGGNGGASSITATGITTITCNGGTGGAGSTSGATGGGAGGTASGGTINATGSNGFSAVSVTVSGGKGGDNMYGQGGGPGTIAVANAGNAATGFGGGGGGAVSTTALGGAGAAGLVMVIQLTP